MIAEIKKDCPHIEKNNLIDINKFKHIPFGKLKCKKCDENARLWICLICGEASCSNFMDSHFIDHNKENPGHWLFIGLMDLMVGVMNVHKINQVIKCVLLNRKRLLII